MTTDNEPANSRFRLPNGVGTGGTLFGNGKLKKKEWYSYNSVLYHLVIITLRKYTHCVEPVLLARWSDVVLARGDDVPAQALTAILSALSWAMCRLSSSNCWLHLWFCSLRCWFWASKSLSLLVTHSLMRAALASTIFASWSLSWRCNRIRKLVSG